MAKPFDEGSSSESHAQERIQTSLANCTASSPGQYSPHARLSRHQGEHCDRAATTASFRGPLTCGMNSTTNSSLPGETQQIQSVMLDAGMNLSLVAPDDNHHQQTGNEDMIIRQIGMQLRLMGDQLHTSHMERVVAWDRRHWPIWYWTFLNFFMHTMAIFRIPRWR